MIMGHLENLNECSDGTVDGEPSWDMECWPKSKLSEQKPRKSLHPVSLKHIKQSWSVAPFLAVVSFSTVRRTNKKSQMSICDATTIQHFYLFAYIYYSLRWRRFLRAFLCTFANVQTGVEAATYLWSINHKKIKFSLGCARARALVMHQTSIFKNAFKVYAPWSRNER